MLISLESTILLSKSFLPWRFGEAAAEVPCAATTKVISTIKIWEISPLDPLNISFSKALEIKQTFKETSEVKSFDLDRTKWIAFRDRIFTKSDRCCLEKILYFPLTTIVPAARSIDLVKYHAQFIKLRVKEFGDSFWDVAVLAVGISDEDKNKLNDKRILSNMLGEFLISSLTVSGRKKVKVKIAKYQRTLDGVTYIDGGMVYWIIANLTQPNNDRLAESFFEELNIIYVKTSSSRSKMCSLVSRNCVLNLIPMPLRTIITQSS